MKSLQTITFSAKLSKSPLKMCTIMNFSEYVICCSHFNWFGFLKGFFVTHGARSIQPKFQPVRPGKVVHLKRWTRFFETFPVGPNRSIEFWAEISRNFGWMGRAHGLRPVKPGRKAADLITPPYVENNYRIEVKLTFVFIAYLVLLCEFFGEFSIFHFCRPQVDI